MPDIDANAKAVLEKYGVRDGDAAAGGKAKLLTPHHRLQEFQREEKLVRAERMCTSVCVFVRTSECVCYVYECVCICLFVCVFRSYEKLPFSVFILFSLLLLLPPLLPLSSVVFSSLLFPFS